MQPFHHHNKTTENAIYRVVGNRNKNVPKSEAAMQTDASSALLKRELLQASANTATTGVTGASSVAAGSTASSSSFDWKQAMAHNASVLSSQEKAMDEYLRRQRSAAEHHIAAANTQLQMQQQRQQEECLKSPLL
jgi:hypothetical protein